MAASPLASTGTITKGIKPKTFVAKTIEFVESQLHEWRDDSTRKHSIAENALNLQLCKFLSDRARRDFPMACFNHEEPQTGQRRVDLSVTPSSEAIEASLYDSIYDPFLVIEGKRLPAPSAGREREYLTGLDDKSGGVQRFRLCLHGHGHAIAVIVGYLQSGSASDWHSTINGWIGALEKSSEDKTCSWSSADNLASLANDGTSKAARCESKHDRDGGSAPIELVHLWIKMPDVAKTKRGAKRKKKAPKKAA